MLETVGKARVSLVSKQRTFVLAECVVSTYDDGKGLGVTMIWGEKLVDSVSSDDLLQNGDKNSNYKFWIDEKKKSASMALHVCWNLIQVYRVFSRTNMCTRAMINIKHFMD